MLQTVVETPEYIKQADNCMANLTSQEKKLLKKIIKSIVQVYGEDHHE